MFGKKKVTRSVVGYSLEGLPIAENTFVQVILSAEQLQLTAVIKHGSGKPTEQKFTLDLSKVKNVQIMDERQIKQVVEQSAPGMVLGAAAFGIVGAMIGGRVQTKEKVDIHNLLVIDYESGGEKQIVLDCSKDNPANHSAFMKYYRELKPEATAPASVEL